MVHQQQRYIGCTATCYKEIVGPGCWAIITFLVKFHEKVLLY